jgi:hypothetical protein
MTGQIVWTMHVPLDEQRAFYAAHPPRALDGLSCTAIDLPDHTAREDPTLRVLLSRIGNLVCGRERWKERGRALRAPASCFSIHGSNSDHRAPLGPHIAQLQAMWPANMETTPRTFEFWAELFPSSARAHEPPHHRRSMAYRGCAPTMTQRGARRALCASFV